MLFLSFQNCCTDNLVHPFVAVAKQKIIPMLKNQILLPLNASSAKSTQIVSQVFASVNEEDVSEVNSFNKKRSYHNSSEGDRAGGTQVTKRILSASNVETQVNIVDELERIRRGYNIKEKNDFTLKALVCDPHSSFGDIYSELKHHGWKTVYTKRKFRVAVGLPDYIVDVFLRPDIKLETPGIMNGLDFFSDRQQLRKYLFELFTNY